MKMKVKVKLNELGVISTGNTPSKNVSEFYASEDIGFVKPDIISDSQIDYIVKTAEYLSEAARAKARIVKKDAVFVTCIGSIGKVGIAKGDEFAFNQQINAIEPNEKIIPKYLAYSIFANKKKLQAIANAPVVPIINKTQFGEFEIDITDDVDEQARIVELLDKVCSIIADRKIELEKMDDLIKARFIEMFGDPISNPMGWEKVNISTVIGGKVSNGFFAKRDEYSDNGNVKVLGVANVVNRMYSNTEELPQTNGTDADIQKYGVKYGDMLFCRSSLVAAGIGKASIVPKGVPNNVLFECHVIRLPLDLNKCVPEFIQVLSNTDYFRNQVISQSKTATMTTIGQDGILKTEIILPPLEFQKRFLMFVEQIDKSKVAVQKALGETQMLFDSLMQDYFGCSNGVRK